MAREAVRANNADHPWLTLADDELLHAARLYGRYQLTGESGFNLTVIAPPGKADILLDIMLLY